MSSVAVILRVIFGGGVWQTSHLFPWEEFGKCTCTYKAVHKLQKVKGCFASVCSQRPYSMECGIP